MSTEIYYFSGTGNSLATARNIAEKTNGKLISIPSVMDQESLKTEHLPFNELIPSVDRSFQYGEKCNGCGLCTRVCPVNNIKMIENRPVWQHHCENCYACYGWCPEEAIYGDIVSYNKRYHHPEVKISDMLQKS